MDARLPHKDSASSQGAHLWFVFYLQIVIKRKWSRGDSNPWPPPCKGGKIVFRKFLELAKCLQIAVFACRRSSQHFRIFTRVAARLLHTCCIFSVS